MMDAALESRGGLVAMWKGATAYCDVPPFDPHEQYPEFGHTKLSCAPNPGYTGVRECLHLLGLDREHLGTPAWNPLGGIVRPGDKVVVKPNFVRHDHMAGGNRFSVITHPSVIRAVLDYVHKAIGGRGQIVVADSPQIDCDFGALLRNTHMATIQEYFRLQHGFEVKIVDLRSEWESFPEGQTGVVRGVRHSLPGDPLGRITVNLGTTSAYQGTKGQKQYYGADYNRAETRRYHHGDVHSYEISATVLDADVLISVPKLKVHQKVGVTLNAKGMVGISVNKNCLVHYTLGPSDKGGDQFAPGLLTPREKWVIGCQRFLYDMLLAKRLWVLDGMYSAARNIFRLCVRPWVGGVTIEKRLLDGGNWWGNDSAWRMVVDLVRIASFADSTGVVRSTPQRRFFSFVDGIVGGENVGPLSPDEKAVGIILAGCNPIAVDLIGARLMGMNERRLRWLTYMLSDPRFGIKLDEISLLTNDASLRECASSTSDVLGFKVPPGWVDGAKAG